MRPPDSWGEKLHNDRKTAEAHPWGLWLICFASVQYGRPNHGPSGGKCPNVGYKDSHQLTDGWVPTFRCNARAPKTNVYTEGQYEIMRLVNLPLYRNARSVARPFLTVPSNPGSQLIAIWYLLEYFLHRQVSEVYGVRDRLVESSHHMRYHYVFTVDKTYAKPEIGHRKTGSFIQAFSDRCCSMVSMYPL